MKQREKAVEVEDLIGDAVRSIGQPGDPPGKANIVIVNGGIHHNITINHPPQLDDLLSLIKSHLGQLTTPAIPSHTQTRLRTRSSRLAHGRPRQPQSHRANRRRPAHPAGRRLTPGRSSICANYRRKKGAFASNPGVFFGYFVPNASPPVFPAYQPQTLAPQAFQPGDPRKPRPPFCANCPPPSHRLPRHLRRGAVTQATRTSAASSSSRPFQILNSVDQFPYRNSVPSPPVQC